MATSRLSFQGFTPTAAGSADKSDVKDTIIYDYTGNAKPASLQTLRQVLNVRAENVIVQPDPNRAIDFKIVLGATYNACTYRRGQTTNQ